MARRSSPARPATSLPNSDRADEGFVTAEFDLDAIATARASWGLFRDRRPDLYGVLGRHDGTQG